MKSQKEFSPAELIEYSKDMAAIQLESMTDEEAISMVRDFTQVMADWQPAVKQLSDEPIQMATACLSLAALFQDAFIKAYGFTEKRMAAEEALQKALGGAE